MWRGALIKLKTENVVDGVKELIYSVIMSLMPVWLSLIFAWLSSVASIKGFLTGFLSSGEALLMSSALVGPLLYTLLKRYGNVPRELTIRFPFGWLFVLFISVICVLAASVFGYNAAQGAGQKILPLNMIILSLTVIATSFLVMLGINIGRNYIETGPARRMPDETQSFLEDWDKS